MLRISCIAPGSLLHKATADLTISGYSIPRGTHLVANFMSTHMDPEFWERPEDFCPDRFLDSTGTMLRDIPHFFPFSIGKRVCLGESLARVELFLFFTILVKNFQFLPARNQPLPDPTNYQNFRNMILVTNETYNRNYGEFE